MKILLVILTFVCAINLQAQDGRLIGNEIGILEANIETYKENIIIYNHDGTIWMQFDFDYESKVENKHNYTIDDIKKLYKWNEDFDPYEFHIDYAILMFICSGIEGDRYKVVVNKQSGLEKYIKKESTWGLRNWQEHILHSVASVEFNFQNNQIRTTPTKESEIIKITGKIDPIIEPIEINENWLKVKFWENEKEKTGWILWRNENRIIINLYYLI